MKSVILLLSALCGAAAFVSMSKMAKSGNDILAQSIISGQMVRQCSCEEETICVAEMKKQVEECSAQCISVFSPVTKTPQALGVCINNIKPILFNFIDCARTNMNSCVTSNAGPRIPYHDIRLAFSLGEKGFGGEREKMMNEGMVKKMRPVAETALVFGACVESCFLNEKNGKGFCFDRYRCQPLIVPESLKSTLKTCGKGLNWKQYAGDMCTCAQGAGVVGLENVCPLLRVMG